MDKMQSLLKSITSVFIFLMTLSNIHGFEILISTEGEKAELNFPFPCNSSHVTLQQGFRAPFYNSAHPNSSLLSKKRFMIKNVTEYVHCSFQLIISPVQKDDEGEYILTPYNNGHILPDTRISLRVEAPPGQASCVTQVVYVSDWMLSVNCTARIGDSLGQIICYQNNMMLPSLKSATEIGDTLNHIMLAGMSGSLYCCSSTLQRTKERCECMDWGWDPKHNFTMTTINPCPTASPVHSSTSDKDLKDNTTLIQASQPAGAQTQPTPTDTLESNSSKVTIFVSTIIISVVLILIVMAVYFRKVKERLPTIKLHDMEKAEETSTMTKTSRKDDWAKAV